MLILNFHRRQAQTFVDGSERDEVPLSNNGAASVITEIELNLVIDVYREAKK